MCGRFFRSIDWAQLHAGQMPSPLRLDDINDIGPRSTSKSKAQVGRCIVTHRQPLPDPPVQAVIDETGKKPAEGLGGDNAFKDFDYSRAANQMTKLGLDADSS